MEQFCRRVRLIPSEIEMPNPLKNKFVRLVCVLMAAGLSVGFAKPQDRPIITELSGHRYRLDDSAGLSAYIKELDRAIEKEKPETSSTGKAHRKGKRHKSITAGEVDPQLVRTMELTRGVAVEL